MLTKPIGNEIDGFHLCLRFCHAGPMEATMGVLMPTWREDALAGAIIGALVFLGVALLLQAVLAVDFGIKPRPAPVPPAEPHGQPQPGL